jgi:hypothetical protein
MHKDKKIHVNTRKSNFDWMGLYATTLFVLGAVAGTYLAFK